LNRENNNHRDRETIEFTNEINAFTSTLFAITSFFTKVSIPKLGLS